MTGNMLGDGSILETEKLVEMLVMVSRADMQGLFNNIYSQFSTKLALVHIQIQVEVTQYTFNTSSLPLFTTVVCIRFCTKLYLLRHVFTYFISPLDYGRWLF